MAGKTTLKISINASTGNVEVSDSVSGKKGGAVRAKSGHRIKWERDGTVKTFSLSFVRITDPFDLILDGAEALTAAQADWPFKKSKVKPKTSADIDEVDCEVTNAESFSGRLEKVENVTVYKYSIDVFDGAKTLQLDPPIIIDPY